MTEAGESHTYSNLVIFLIKTYTVGAFKYNTLSNIALSLSNITYKRSKEC